MNKISVCIATYNGERFISRQIDSILSELGSNDEVIISDDSSTDSTISIIKSYNDPRIVIFENQQFHSPVLNFENAIKNAKGDIIFLADQDDKWLAGRVAKALELHGQGYDLVICNTRNVYKDHISEVVNNPFKRSFFQNLKKPAFVGCCMSFKKELKKMILPFPKSIAMHDLWIGLLGQRNFKCGYIDKPLVEYNRHEESFVAKHPLSMTKRIEYRVNMYLQVIKREKEVEV